jgi:hypothetical protein
MWRLCEMRNLYKRSGEMLKYRVLGLILVFSLACSSMSYGDLVLDQASEVMWDVGAGLERNWWVWQEFRPTMDNLEQVDVYLMNAFVPSTVTVSFQVRDGGTVLWGTSFSADLISGVDWFEIDTPQISLVPDDSYRLYLTSDLTYEQILGGAGLSWEAARNDPYSRGISSWESDIDFAFHTWAVPEPMTILLLSFGSLTLLRKHRK